MKRLLAVFVIGIGISAAPKEAKPRMIRLPWAVSACPAGATWDTVTTCLGKHGDVTLVQEVGDAKLVHVVESKTSTELGLYLYVKRGAKWQLGGMYESSTGYKNGVLSSLKVGAISGWRIDLEIREDTQVQLDAVTETPAIVDEKLALLCSGAGYRCTQATTSCDVLIHGKAYWSFRGKLAIDHDVVHVTGDRSNAGAMCASPTDITLGWVAE